MSANPSAAQFARRHAKALVLTPDRVREMRLSLDPDAVWAERLGVNRETIRTARTGITYGDLREDEARTMRQRRNAGRVKPDAARLRLADHQLLIGSVFPVTGRADLDERFDQIAALDADNECGHGRLPHDRTSACGCWPQEITKTNPKEEPHGSNHRALDRLQRFEEQVRNATPVPGRDADHRPVRA